MEPRVDLELSMSADNNLDGIFGHNNDELAMFRLRYKLFNGGADAPRIDETELLSEQAK